MDIIQECRVHAATGKLTAPLWLTQRCEWSNSIGLQHSRQQHGYISQAYERPQGAGILLCSVNIFACRCAGLPISHSPEFYRFYLCVYIMAMTRLVRADTPPHPGCYISSLLPPKFFSPAGKIISRNCLHVQ
jgi:hypothetical protein